MGLDFDVADKNAVHTAFCCRDNPCANCAVSFIAQVVVSHLRIVKIEPEHLPESVDNGRLRGDIVAILKILYPVDY